VRRQGAGIDPYQQPEGAGKGHRAFFDRAAQSWDIHRDPDVERRLAGLLARVALRPGARVLDVGTGTGILVPHLWKAMEGRGSIVAFDFSLEMLCQAQAKRVRASLLQVNAMSLPFTENSFDHAICNAVFPHLPDKDQALAELSRVLKPSGELAICHAWSRQHVNMFHRTAGGAVAHDMLPDEAEMGRLLSQADFDEIHIWDEQDRYLALARKG